MRGEIGRCVIPHLLIPELLGVGKDPKFEPRPSLWGCYVGAAALAIARHLR